MDTIPDVTLEEILSYLPNRSYLPTAHVSKRFRVSWLEIRGDGRQLCDENGMTTTTTNKESMKTNPLQLGNLFQKPWTHASTTTSSSLCTSLLRYYISCGWNTKQNMRAVMIGAAARGDIRSMSFMDSNKYYLLTEDVEICTTAGAAGRLEALKWLREVKGCPWDAQEVYEESAENDYLDVIDYVERNRCEGEEIDVNYGGAC